MLLSYYKIAAKLILQLQDIFLVIMYVLILDDLSFKNSLHNKNTTYGRKVTSYNFLMLRPKTGKAY